jgi:hypothetical protein
MHYDASLDALPTTFIKTTCRKFMVACEASGAREHGHDSKQSGRANNASKGVDESVCAVQLVEHAGTKVAKGR